MANNSGSNVQDARSDRLTLAHSAKPSDRRAAPRARTVLEGAWEELARTRPVRVSGLSETGCYIETVTLPRTGEALNVRVELPQGALRTQGVVVYTEPQMGFGLRFLDLTPEFTGLLAGAVEMLNHGAHHATHSVGPTSMVA